MTAHLTSIVKIPKGYRAMCDCGWSLDVIGLKKDAKQKAWDHWASSPLVSK